MKTLSVGKFQEHRTYPFAKAAVLLALAGCNEASAPRPVTVVEVAAQPSAEQDAPRAPEPVRPRADAEALVPATMTLLRTGDIFLAYVSVPDGDSMRDLDEPKSSFSYSVSGGRWTTIFWCERTFSCDVSALMSLSPFGLRIKAEFSEPGYSPCASEPHPAGGR